MTADAAAKKARDDLDATYEGQPIGGWSIEEFRQRQEKAQRKPRWQQELG